MANMGDVNDDDFLVLDMAAAGELLGRIRQGSGKAICLAILLREKKPTWRYYKKEHHAEWKLIEKRRAENPGRRTAGLHEPPDGYIGGFRRMEILRVEKNSARKA